MASSFGDFSYSKGLLDDRNSLETASSRRPMGGQVVAESEK